MIARIDAVVMGYRFSSGDGIAGFDQWTEVCCTINEIASITNRYDVTIE